MHIRRLILCLILCLIHYGKGSFLMYRSLWRWGKKAPSTDMITAYYITRRMVRLQRVCSHNTITVKQVEEGAIKGGKGTNKMTMGMRSIGRMTKLVNGGIEIHVQNHVTSSTDARSARKGTRSVNSVSWGSLNHVHTGTALELWNM